MTPDETQKFCQIAMAMGVVTEKELREYEAQASTGLGNPEFYFLSKGILEPETIQEILEELRNYTAEVMPVEGGTETALDLEPFHPVEATLDKSTDQNVLDLGEVKPMPDLVPVGDEKAPADKGDIESRFDRLWDAAAPPSPSESILPPDWEGCVNHPYDVAVTRCVGCDKPLCSGCVQDMSKGTACSRECAGKMHDSAESILNELPDFDLVPGVAPSHAAPALPQTGQAKELAKEMETPLVIPIAWEEAVAAAEKKQPPVPVPGPVEPPPQPEALLPARRKRSTGLGLAASILLALGATAFLARELAAPPREQTQGVAVTPPASGTADGTLLDASRLLRSSAPLYEQVAPSMGAPLRDASDREAFLRKARKVEADLSDARALYAANRHAAPDPALVDGRIAVLDEALAKLRLAMRWARSE